MVKLETGGRTRRSKLKRRKTLVEVHLQEVRDKYPTFLTSRLSTYFRVYDPSLETLSLGPRR